MYESSKLWVQTYVKFLKVGIKDVYICLKALLKKLV